MFPCYDRVFLNVYWQLFWRLIFGYHPFVHFVFRFCAQGRSGSRSAKVMFLFVSMVTKVMNFKCLFSINYYDAYVTLVRLSSLFAFPFSFGSQLFSPIVPFWMSLSVLVDR